MNNPFLDDQFRINWEALTPDRVEPALDQALREAESALAAIGGLDDADADYARTFLALEAATIRLNEVWAKISHLSSVADSAPMRAAYNAALPRYSAFQTKVPLDPRLWSRLKIAAATSAARALTGEERRFVDETLEDFRQQGADLPAEQKARLEQLQRELSVLAQKYAENVLDATNAWELVVRDAARLRGLPERVRVAARENALQKGLGSDAEPAWRFTLHQPSQEPVLLYAEDESLRREVWEAASRVGTREPHANRELVGRILQLRAEKARLLGAPHFADLLLARRMAKSGAQALAFIERMHRRVGPAFERECRELEEYKARATGAPVARLAPWDLGFWAERLRRERHAFDPEALRPYFALPSVLAGLFEIVRRVFGLEVRELAVPASDVWHADVKFYEVRDEDGRHLGSFYTDWFPRESKRGGAWMNYLITGGPVAGGGRQPHLGLMCGNLTPPSAGGPALLGHREVETIFHEFGHLLHHLCGEVRIKSLNGVNVAWDFVELPSQIMENWCWERASLDLFARHHETGAAIPEELFARMVAARNFRTAAATMRQLAFARMDLDLHLADPVSLGTDVAAWLKARLSGYLIPTEPTAPTIENRFNHIFADPVGYAAGYYSYKWAEVLEADAFSRFREAGIFSRQVGREFVARILSRGNGADPMSLFIEFMGRPPTEEALLQRAGLV